MHRPLAIAVRPFLVAAGILMLTAAITLAGCAGGSGDGEDAGTAAGSDPAAAGGGSGEGPSPEQEEQMLKWADCLREHGMDVSVDGGRFQMRGQGDQAAAQEAQEACRDLAPEGMGAGGTASPEQKREMLEYIQCLRGEGIELSDPDPETGSPASEDARKFMNPDADMQAAMEACKDARPSRMMLQSGGGSE